MIERLTPDAETGEYNPGEIERAVQALPEPLVARNQLMLRLGAGQTQIVETRGFATVASTATLTVNSNLVTHQTVSAQAEALTINYPTGAPAPGQKLTIFLKDNGTARALTWQAGWGFVGTTKPNATTPGKRTIIKAEYADGLWNVYDIKTQDIGRSALPVCQTAPATNGTDQWAKLCTFTTGTAQNAAVNLTLSVESAGQAGGTQQIQETAIITVSYSSTATNNNPVADIQMIARSGGNRHFGPDSFKLISGGWGTPAELWIKKNSANGFFDVFELTRTRSNAGLTEVTYNNAAVWQAAAPVGLVNNITTKGVVVAGNPVAVKVAVPSSAIAVGYPGQWAADDAWHYTYTGDGVAIHTWRRVAHATW